MSFLHLQMSIFFLKLVSFPFLIFYFSLKKKAIIKQKLGYFQPLHFNIPNNSVYKIFFRNFIFQTKYFIKLISVFKKYKKNSIIDQYVLIFLKLAPQFFFENILKQTPIRQ